MNTHELAVDAMMAMLERYGGVWGSDREWLRGQVSVIIDAATMLGMEDPQAWREAEATLKNIRHTGSHPTTP